MVTYRRQIELLPTYRLHSVQACAGVADSGCMLRVRTRTQRVPGDLCHSLVGICASGSDRLAGTSDVQLDHLQLYTMRARLCGCLKYNVPKPHFALGRGARPAGRFRIPHPAASVPGPGYTAAAA